MRRRLQTIGTAGHAQIDGLRTAHAQEPHLENQATLERRGVAERERHAREKAVERQKLATAGGGRHSSMRYEMLLERPLERLG